MSIRFKEKITPCLWFDGEAEEAAKFYVGIFKNSRVVDTLYHGEAGPGPKGSVLTVTFELEGQEFLALNGESEFAFSPSISFFVLCDTQEEVDGLWEKLLAGGGETMACGWLRDKFGVCWQIVPANLMEYLHDKDEAKVARVMRAMMAMIKLDGAALTRAYEGR